MSDMALPAENTTESERDSVETGQTSFISAVTGVTSAMESLCNDLAKTVTHWRRRMSTAKDSEVLPQVSNWLTNLYRVRLISIDVVRAEVRGGTGDCVTAMESELLAYSACCRRTMHSSCQRRIWFC
jgi:hypothetical protein